MAVHNTFIYLLWIHHNLEHPFHHSCPECQNFHFVLLVQGFQNHRLDPFEINSIHLIEFFLLGSYRITYLDSSTASCAISSRNTFNSSNSFESLWTGCTVNTWLTSLATNTLVTCITFTCASTLFTHTIRLYIAIFFQAFLLHREKIIIQKSVEMCYDINLVYRILDNNLPHIFD